MYGVEDSDETCKILQGWARIGSDIKSQVDSDSTPFTNYKEYLDEEIL